MEHLSKKIYKNSFKKAREIPPPHPQLSPARRLHSRTQASLPPAPWDSAVEKGGTFSCPVPTPAVGWRLYLLLL